MNRQQLLENYNNLQKIYGEKTLDPIIGGGQEYNPEICFIFMNPTGRNIASEKTWKSLKYPWIGTKNVWKLFLGIDRFDKDLFQEIKDKKPYNWDYSFAEKVYEEVRNKRMYLTNLAKCTQLDARPLPNSVFKEYRDLLLEELNIVNPGKIVVLGNQVSSILLERNISVSKERKNIYGMDVLGITRKILSTYYPVGQGQRNMDKAVEDIKWFLNS